MTAEHSRLVDSEARRADWKQWGPYLSERAWGTVREDYSATGEAWEHFPHDHARSRAYRWNEDGLAGFCDRDQRLCLGLGLWNEQDPILKERLFGLTGTQGNHGEDVKEYYYYLDSTPTHSYAKMLYKYPHVAYPYETLVRENEARGRHDPEFELGDALGNAFSAGRYFDVVVEYAKQDEDDLFGRITVYNRGPDAAPIHVLPHLWFRNQWTWTPGTSRPSLEATGEHEIRISAPELGTRWWYVQAPRDAHLLFTENETNHTRLWGSENATDYVKDGINDYVVHGASDAVHPEQTGTKAAAHIRLNVPAGGSETITIRMTPERKQRPFVHCRRTFERRINEADAFYDDVAPDGLSNDDRRIHRQAYAGLMWTKQFYHYDVAQWLDGDVAQPDPPEGRWRNADWRHLNNQSVISMPDAWEYPWYAAWDLAFHMIPVAHIDPEWAKRQMVLLTREWYMHPNGQMPAYEWAFDDANPPVHAWAAWRVYQIDRAETCEADTIFLEKIFHKMLLNFTWWVNQKDHDGNNIFQGGFLGLDNIGVFDRSQSLPTGGHLEQADGTAWMGMFCLNTLRMALELAQTKPAYEDVATKFFEHFVHIAHAINKKCGGTGLWDAEDGFFYDTIHCPSGDLIPLEIRSFVGLIPLFAVERLGADLIDALPDFKKRMNWFIEERPHLMEHLTFHRPNEKHDDCLLALVNEEQFTRIVERMLDEDQFLSDYGLRALSKEHEAHPFTFAADGNEYTVQYEPAESTTGLFGGNSNWRGPIWFPVNYLMLESLRRFDIYYGDDMQVEYPTGSGDTRALADVATAISERLANIFRRDDHGERPVFGGHALFHEDPHWRDYPLFYEYFHGDNGAGIGASHQTGWTALVATLLEQIHGECSVE